MQELPLEQQDVINLAYFSGMSHTDIATYRAIPLGTVKTRIRQGMHKLRAIWLSESPMHPKQDSNT
jgi:RNA polymerase sigma-70 factor (ECF subfamily)